MVWCEATVFGGECLKLLGLIRNEMDRCGNTLHHNFLHDEYVDLNTPESERITSRIDDVTGGLLKVNYAEKETQLQLGFKQHKSNEGTKVT